MDAKKKIRQSLFLSFKNALWGIGHTIKEERNIKIHFVAVLVVGCVGYLTKISLLEWCCCMVVCGMVIAAELVNSAVENIIDMVMPRKHPLARAAKDAAAGAVLVCAITAVAVGVIIFIPKVWQLLNL